MALTHKPKEEVPFKINLHITHKHDQPCIVLRRETTDTEIIKTLVSCAYHGVPVTILPHFTDPIQSLNTLIEKGVIYKKTHVDPDTGQIENQYFYNI